MDNQNGYPTKILGQANAFRSKGYKTELFTLSKNGWICYLEKQNNISSSSRVLIGSKINLLIWLLSRKKSGITYLRLPRLTPFVLIIALIMKTKSRILINEFPTYPHKKELRKLNFLREVTIYFGNSFEASF